MALAISALLPTADTEYVWNGYSSMVGVGVMFASAILYLALYLHAERVEILSKFFLIIFRIKMLIQKEIKRLKSKLQVWLNLLFPMQVMLGLLLILNHLVEATQALLFIMK